jgi:hypothetical protein
MNHISFAPRQTLMAQVSNRGALTSTNFRVTGSNQATRRNAKINPHKIAQTVPSECARKSQIVCSFAIALERDNTNIVAYTPLEKSTRTRDAVIKWFVQSATHQNNLDLKLAFREHGNVLSPCNHQCVIVQTRFFIPSINTAYRPHGCQKQTLPQTTGILPPPPRI